MGCGAFLFVFFSLEKMRGAFPSLCAAGAVFPSCLPACVQNVSSGLGGPLGVVDVFGRCDHRFDLLQDYPLGFFVQLPEQLLNFGFPAIAVNSRSRLNNLGLNLCADQRLHWDLQSSRQGGKAKSGRNLLVALVTGDTCLGDPRRLRELNLGQPGPLSQFFDLCSDAHLQRMM